MKPLTQARILALVGFHEAGAMIARRNLEAQMKAILQRESPAKGWARRPSYMGGILRSRGIINQPQLALITKTYKWSSNVAHGNPVTRQRCSEIISNCITISGILKAQ